MIQVDSSVPLKSKPVELKDVGDFAALLTDPIPLPNGDEPPEGTLPRTFSLWQQTDPVALYKGKVNQGTAELAACYANNMFNFTTEENLQEFVKEPRKFLS